MTRYTTALALLFFALGSTPSAAGDQTEQAQARAALQRGEILPLSRILAIAEKHAPGDVIKVKLEQEDNGRFEYELKVLSRTGRILEIELDARTGAVLEIEED